MLLGIPEAQVLGGDVLSVGAAGGRERERMKQRDRDTENTEQDK